ncbi:hypothetical protein BJF78_07875 [Pseudonocardia sp. CNS-139]|nr:hypothetical protein BJF78_07875 [Pseudonocardia sp. CNS-139]
MAGSPGPSPAGPPWLAATIAVASAALSPPAAAVVVVAASGVPGAPPSRPGSLLRRHPVRHPKENEQPLLRLRSVTNYRSMDWRPGKRRTVGP